MQLTQEHFDKTIQTLLSQVALQQSLNQTNDRIEKIESVLEVHTKALDRLLKDLDKRDQEKDVSIERFERLERWAKQVGEKMGVKLEL